MLNNPVMHLLQLNHYNQWRFSQIVEFYAFTDSKKWSIYGEITPLDMSSPLASVLVGLSLSFTHATRLVAVDSVDIITSQVLTLSLSIRF